MLGISDEMEAALAYVALRENENIPNFDDSVMPSEDRVPKVGVTTVSQAD